MATDHSHHLPERHHLPEPGALNHETTDVSLTGITRLTIATFVLIFITLTLMYGTWRLFENWTTDKTPPPPMSSRQPGVDRLPAGGPPILVNEPLNLQQFRASEEAILHGYGWVDKTQGVVRIPVDRAMDLIVERNSIPSAPAATADPAGATAPAPAASGHATPPAPHAAPAPRPH